MTTNEPRAIAMWDFSWLERRWSGGGYEDWDRALDELVERGYDAVRIDAYPHLMALDPEKTWSVLPQWNQQQWGSPVEIDLAIGRNLITFMEKCAERSIAVGLSTWFQDDKTHARMRIQSPEDHASIWLKTLEFLRAAGLLEQVYFVDGCNEWPQSCWAPFFQDTDAVPWEDGSSLDWIESTTGCLRRTFPELAFTFSNAVFKLPDTSAVKRWKAVDFLEPHIWMAIANDMEYYKKIPYNFERFDPSGFERIVALGEKTYREQEGYWRGLLDQAIEAYAGISRETGLPLVTTECWGVVDFKDGPGMDWGYVKELCAYGVGSAVQTGRWAAVATSNFCGPQFDGMWGDVEWHRRLTDKIKKGR